MRKGVEGEIVDGLLGAVRERLEDIKLRAAYAQLLFNCSPGDPKTLDDRSNRINDSDDVRTQWPFAA